MALLRGVPARSLSVAGAPHLCLLILMVVTVPLVGAQGEQRARTDNGSVHDIFRLLCGKAAKKLSEHFEAVLQAACRSREGEVQDSVTALISLLNATQEALVRSELQKRMLQQRLERQSTSTAPSSGVAVLVACAAAAALSCAVTLAAVRTRDVPSSDGASSVTGPPTPCQEATDDIQDTLLSEAILWRLAMEGEGSPAARKTGECGIPPATTRRSRRPRGPYPPPRPVYAHADP
eukprot:TRINITY_DN52787_c0_g1_i1.p1 TRINITY_DN52787_c0_g1~~TRINITY_DN52787_c0_g1_i1.p1  ORF type:complete len:235 (+),score=47.50 TRINITY_DN52787_c0_g1_i1:78-782(+)